MSEKGMSDWRLLELVRDVDSANVRRYAIDEELKRLRHHYEDEVDRLSEEFEKASREHSELELSLKAECSKRFPLGSKEFYQLLVGDDAEWLIDNSGNIHKFARHNLSVGKDE